MKTSAEILEAVNAYLAGVTDGRTPATLYEPIRYVLSMGGKRIRPTLMLLAFNMYNDEIDSIMPQACGLEIYHNYTLLHDDLMDNASLRRGKKTVHCRWNANAAILSGDTMLVMAYEYISNCDERKLPAIMRLFTKTAIEIGEGQQYDMDFETRSNVTEGEYIEMIRLKTSVLLACALKMGALLAGASQSDADNLYAFGEKIGLAFQLQDDYLDVYGNPDIFGKNIGGDILSNKKTYMLINAYNKADDASRNELTRWIEAKDYDPSEKIAAVTNIYNRLGIPAMVEKRIGSFFEQSRRFIAQVSVPYERKRQLAAFTAAMMKRKY